MSDFDWLDDDSEEARLRRKLERSRKFDTSPVADPLNDEDLLRSLGISIAAERPAKRARPFFTERKSLRRVSLAAGEIRREAVGGKQPAPKDDDPRGSAKLQEIMREWRPQSEITRSEGWRKIALRSSILEARENLMFAIRVDVNRTPRSGDVILTSRDWATGYGREYDFALVTRVVSTGGLHVRRCRWDRRIGYFSSPTSYSRRWLTTGFINVEGVVTTPERLQLPARRMKNGRWAEWGEPNPCQICGRGPADPAHRNNHGV